MARGWESKDVESQQEALADRKAEAKAKSDRDQQIEDLRLQRTRVMRDLRAALNPRYRDILMQSLRFLEARISELEGSATPPPAESPQE